MVYFLLTIRPKTCKNINCIDLSGLLSKLWACARMLRNEGKLRKELNMKKKTIGIAIVLLVCFAVLAFTQDRPRPRPQTIIYSCPAHIKFNDRCSTCLEAQRNREIAQKRLAEQKAELAKKEREKAAAKTVAEANQIEREIQSIRIIIVEIEADLR